MQHHYCKLSSQCPYIIFSTWAYYIEDNIKSKNKKFGGGISHGILHISH